MVRVFIIMVVASASLFSAVALEGDAVPANAEQEGGRKNVLKVRDNPQEAEQDKKPCGSLVDVEKTGGSRQEGAAETHRLCQEIVRLLDLQKEEPIENKSFPFDEELEKSRLVFLQARAACKTYYVANQVLFDRVRDLHESIMPMLCPTLKKEDQPRYMSLQGELGGLRKSNAQAFTRIKNLRWEYYRTMYVFTGKYMRYARLSDEEEEQLRAGIKSRLGVCVTFL